MNYRKWTQLLIVNFILLAILGLIMRYKIAFSFPYLDQKHIQHAHSHFAFVAWISQALYIFLIHYLEKYTTIRYRKYEFVLVTNTLLSYAMMISFLLKGYHISSNLFSFLIIVNSLYFTYIFIKDAKFIKEGASILKWFYGALFFNFISMLGTFFLAYMMMMKNYNQDLQLASVYFYLHFQYNGWFIFTCIGLYLHQTQNRFKIKRAGLIFYLFFISTIPSYFLSILWWKFSDLVYWIVVISSIVQFIAGLYLLMPLMKRNDNKVETDDKKYKFIVFIIGLCFVLKLFLQMASTVPFLSHLAYSLRSVVIAYLHLVLLVIISSFLLQYIYKEILNIKINYSFTIFLFFILMNEFLLVLHGIFGAFSISVPFIHYLLLAVSVGIVMSIIKVFSSINRL